MDFSTPKVMGILNLTPDSFFDGGSFLDEKVILQQVEKMLIEGADIIDIGAFSSRPNAELISAAEEKKRLITPLQAIKNTFPEAILSVDTYRSEVVRMVVNEGAQIINDISGGQFDGELFDTIAELKVPYILMHMQGTPKDMQTAPTYDGVFKTIFHFFTQQLEQLNLKGVKDVILDVGFGFGKTLEHNYQLLKQLPYFHSLKRPLLVGVSRKGMIQKVINKAAQDALNGTTAAHVIAIQNGANILRVHDVKAAKEAIQIVDFYQKM